MAASSAPPALPHVFRPRWARRVPLGFAAVLLLGGALLALAPADWPASDRVLMFATAVAGAYFLWRLSDVRILAEVTGLTVVNVVGRRRLEWPEVVALQLRQGDPWLVLDTADGTSVAAMGVQGSEGAYAREQAAQLARLLVQRTTLPPGH